MTRLNNYIINLIKKKLQREDIKIDNLKILNKGKFANAFVYRYKDSKVDYTIKDFYHCPFFIRITFGRIMAKIEYNTLKKLNGIKGIAPEVHMLSPYTIAFSYITGEPLKVYKKTETTIPPEFFYKMEEAVKQMHARNIVHLDLRNFGNIIRGEDGNPYIIDFQSSISTKNFPVKVKTILQNSDISGVYKAWKSICSEPLPKEKEQFLEDFNNIRKLWVLRGYPIQRAIKKWKKRDKKDK